MSWRKSIAILLAYGITPVAMTAPVALSILENNELVSDDVMGVRGVSNDLPSTIRNSVDDCENNDNKCYLNDVADRLMNHGVNKLSVSLPGRQNLESIVSQVSKSLTAVEGNADFPTLTERGELLSKTFTDQLNEGDEYQLASLIDKTDNVHVGFYHMTAELVSKVPEPATLSLLGLGLMTLGAVRKKKK